MPKKVQVKAKGAAYGEFSGEPRTGWIGTGPKANRDMVMLEDFWYIDPAGAKWPADAGRRIDGASIPRVLWTLVGSPYTGCYRKASVVHDVACEDAKQKKDPKKERKKADKMYFRACRRGGCSFLEALVQYLGVRIGAWMPDVGLWSAATAAKDNPQGRVYRTMSDRSIVGTFHEMMAAVIDADTEDIDEIESIAEHHLKTKAKLLARD
jgi:hypothetical protein